MHARVLFLVTAGLLLGGEAPKEEAAKKDLEKLQGEWVMQSSERDGKKLTEKQVEGYSRKIKGNTYTVTIENEEGVRELGGTITLDPTQKPKTIDAQMSDGSMKGQTMLGIYKLEGDMQTVCFAPVGQKRATDFDSKQGTLTVWKRDKKRTNSSLTTEVNGKASTYICDYVVIWKQQKDGSYRAHTDIFN
ncbi:MAG TPA: TIGR03067 domain-containing protein [Gemmataceae bacterium]|jgi:uncharacterized protein (TIGR03067 family)|nr:TIGR03067 domain-containing protein [Gemmataceae bacterium]